MSRPPLRSLALGALLTTTLLVSCQSSSGSPGGTSASCPPTCASGPSGYVIGPKPMPTAGTLDETGKLLFPRRNTLVGFDLQTRQMTPIVEFPDKATLSAPSISPNGQRVAVTVYVPTTERNDLGGADLYLVDLDSGSQQLLESHGTSGVWLSEPAWTPDEQTIYYTRRAAIMENNRYKGEDVRIDRINVDGTSPETVVQNASSPSISADGQNLAYIAPVGGVDPARLWAVPVDRSQQPRQLAGPEFTQLGTPRFAPRGSELAFTGVGGPPNTPVGKITLADTIRGLFEPPVAEAHGIPWDLWVVNADGSGLTRLTDLSEDSPVPAWAPDGSSIAIGGEVGLYLVELATSQTVILAPEPATGLVWSGLA